MTLHQQGAMTDDEIESFLGAHQTAVISFAPETGPYAVPITYRFDPDVPRFYFRLVFPRQSEKRVLIPDIPECWLVSYDEGERRYQSVIAKGQPAEVREDDITADHVAQLGQVTRPLFELWAESRADVDIRLYELEPTELSGRRIVLDDTA